MKWVVSEEINVTYHMYGSTWVVMLPWQITSNPSDSLQQRVIAYPLWQRREWWHTMTLAFFSQSRFPCSKQVTWPNLMSLWWGRLIPPTERSLVERTADIFEQVTQVYQFLERKIYVNIKSYGEKNSGLWWRIKWRVISTDGGGVGSCGHNISSNPENEEKLFSSRVQ